MNPKQRPRGRGNNGGNPNRGMHPHNGGGGQRHINVRTQVFDSNGPEGRIRGNAHQVMEKYLALGRDASAQGDRVAAENFFQHAEHYFRLINAYNQSNPQQQQQPRRPSHPQNAYGDSAEHGDGHDESGQDYAAEVMNTPAGADQGVPVVDMEASDSAPQDSMAAPQPIRLAEPAPNAPQPDLAQMDQPDVVMPLPLDMPVQTAPNGDEPVARRPRRAPVRRRPAKPAMDGEDSTPAPDADPVTL